MPESELIYRFPGADVIVNWFGRWPSFHDAEIISLELNRLGRSYLRVHAFQVTSDVDERHYYRTDKHAIVVFALEDISFLSLQDFSNQNVISGLSVGKVDDGFSLQFYPCYGLSGEIRARTLSVDLSAGVPPGSNYSPKGS